MEVKFRWFVRRNGFTRRFYGINSADATLRKMKTFGTSFSFPNSCLWLKNKF